MLFRSTEFLTVLFGVSGHHDQRPLAVDWTMANYDAIAAKAPPEYTAGLIGVAAGAEPELFARLREFLLDPARKTEFAEVNITKSTERQALRTRLRAKEQANIEKYLRTFAGQIKKD